MAERRISAFFRVRWCDPVVLPVKGMFRYDDICRISFFRPCRLTTSPEKAMKRVCHERISPKKSVWRIFRQDVPGLRRRYRTCPGRAGGSVMLLCKRSRRFGLPTSIVGFPRKSRHVYAEYRNNGQHFFTECERTVAEPAHQPFHPDQPVRRYDHYPQCSGNGNRTGMPVVLPQSHVRHPSRRRQTDFF